MREFQFTGCRRSGNHAVIEWTLNHFALGSLENDVPKNWDGVSRKSQNLLFTNSDREGRASAISREDQEVTTEDEIIILRSAYNVAASRLSSPENYRNSRRMDRFLHIWPNHARSIDLGHRHYVLYDEWLTTGGILDGPKLALPLPYLPLPEWQPKRGKQSTFTERSNSDRLSRFKIIDLPKELLEDDEIRELNHSLFGWTLTRSNEYLS